MLTIILVVIIDHRTPEQINDNEKVLHTAIIPKCDRDMEMRQCHQKMVLKNDCHTLSICKNAKS